MNSQVPRLDIIGESAAMKALSRQVRTAARCDLTVLISGESGTGKELVARANHLQSRRARKPFISLNCETLTETLLESELFGYERGAFTGAHQKKKGLFEAAHTGTIFLDEIAEMTTGCQVKLLRVLQESAFRPVGGHAETAVDVRVLAATNRDRTQEMAAGRFRDDLYYRIAVLTISTPALRRRPSDIPILIEHFLREAQKKLTRSRKHRIDADAITALSAYTWPGNVRQLRHVVERLVATAAEGETCVVVVLLARYLWGTVQPRTQSNLQITRKPFGRPCAYNYNPGLRPSTRSRNVKTVEMGNSGGRRHCNHLLYKLCVFQSAMDSSRRTQQLSTFGNRR